MLKTSFTNSEEYSLASNLDSKILALNYIKEQIITCAMPPGSAINVNDIAAQLNISKTPVREALLELQYENYITVVPRKRTIVSRISLKDLEYIYDARSLVEIHIIRGITPQDVQENHDMLMRIREKWLGLSTIEQTKSAYIDFLQADLQFHSSLIQLCENPHLVHFCQELIYKSQRFWYMALFNNQVDRVQQEHLQILDALLEGDPDKAAECEQAHISASKALSILSD